MIKVIIFDFDGVIAPLNMEILYDVYQHLVEEMNVKSDWGDDFESFVNWFDAKYIRNLERMGMKTEMEFLKADLFFREYLDNKGHHIYPQFRKILRHLRKHFSLGIVSNGPEVRVLKQLGKDLSLFEKIIGRETLKDKMKPDPYGLNLCMQHFPIKPDETLFIGDHYTDMIAGKSAGLKYVFGVSWGMDSPEKLIEHGADFVIDEIEDLETFDVALDALVQI